MQRFNTMKADDEYVRKYRLKSDEELMQEEATLRNKIQSLRDTSKEADAQYSIAQEQIQKAQQALDAWNQRAEALKETLTATEKEFIYFQGRLHKIEKIKVDLVERNKKQKRDKFGAVPAAPPPLPNTGKAAPATSPTTLLDVMNTPVAGDPNTANTSPAPNKASAPAPPPPTTNTPAVAPSQPARKDLQCRFFDPHPYFN